MTHIFHPSFKRQVDALLRFLLLFIGIALLVLGLASVLESLGAYAAEPTLPKVELDSKNAAPRELEETTRAAITREYATAWKNMADALAQNSADGLGASFVGAAHDALIKKIGEQRQNGLSIRILDRGHKLKPVFYSPEGSAMQLRDTAQLELQYLDGGSIVHSEKITQDYVVLMAVTEDRWKIRVLQERAGD
jgi:hypothetical protein